MDKRFEPAFHTEGREGITVFCVCVCVLILEQKKGELGKFLIFFKETLKHSFLL